MMKVNNECLVRDGRVIAIVTEKETDGKGNTDRTYSTINGLFDLMSDLKENIVVDKLLYDTYQRLIDSEKRFQDITREEIEESIIEFPCKGCKLSSRTNGPGEDDECRHCSRPYCDNYDSEPVEVRENMK